MKAQKVLTNRVRISRDHHQLGDAVAIATARGGYIIEGYGEYLSGTEVRCWPTGRVSDLIEVKTGVKTGDRLNAGVFIAKPEKKAAGKLVTTRGNKAITEESEANA